MQIWEKALNFEQKQKVQTKTVGPFGVIRTRIKFFGKLP